MIDQHFPVRPDLDQLKHQAKDLLRQLHQADPAALELLQQRHPHPPLPHEAKLVDAQFLLARSYGLPTWPRLVLACKMTDAIWCDDAQAVRQLILEHPQLLHEDARGVKGNWGPPMSYAANLGRDGILSMLHQMGAADLQHAFDRACLQGKLGTARRLHALGARLEPGLIMGPCETQSADGLALLLELGAELADPRGDRLAPVGLLLETYCRNAEGKHRCLELMDQHGIDLPDTPTMALHRGRIDLLEAHLRRDPRLLGRTFSHGEIYPLELGCHADESLALHGTPVAGTTLLHLCMDFAEPEIAAWLVQQGADVNARAAVDADGFGGHTPLFCCVVSQPYRTGLDRDGHAAGWLLEQGADPTVRASLRKRLRFVPDETLHEYRDVTPLEWGRQFHDQDWVNPAVLRLLAERTP